MPLNIIEKNDGYAYLGYTVGTGLGTPGAEFHTEWGKTNTLMKKKIILNHKMTD